MALPILYLDAEGVGIQDAEAHLAALNAQLDGGAVPSQHEFQAVVFIQGPNRNYLRFYDEDMPAFARSFTGVPFLADHAQRSIEFRYGTVLRSHYEGGEIVQSVRLSRRKAVEEFGAGLIDRFSIGWDYDDIVDSITGQSWFDSPFWPGQKVKQADGTDKVCELYFINPRGVETSAVNVPAVPGTHVLSQLSAARDEWQKSRPRVFAVSLATGDEDAGDRVEFTLTNDLVADVVDSSGDNDGDSGPIETGVEIDSVDTPASDVDEVLGVFVDDGAPSQESNAMDEKTIVEVVGKQDASFPDASVSQAVTPAVAAAATAPAPAAPLADANRYLAVLAQQTLNTLLANSGLSAAGQSVVRSQLSEIPTVDAIQSAIAGQKTVEDEVRASLQTAFDEQAAQMSAQIATLQNQTAVRGLSPADGGKIVVVEDEIERSQNTLNWLMGDPEAKTPSANMRNIAQLYQWMTGDSEWRGGSGWGEARFGGAKLAAGEIANLPNMLVISLNRVLMEIYRDMAQYRWYEPLVQAIPHDGTTRTIDMIMWNEVQDLPTVGEGEPYREAQLGDSKETMMFEKRGMWIGLTLEMIRRNDLLRIREVPRKLMRAAIRTRSATVASIWTQNSGVGPTMADGKALFHADHSNLGTGAFSHANWTVVRQRAFKQTEPGSGKRLGYMPKFLLIPVDILETVMTVFGYGAGSNNVGRPTDAGTAQEVNIYALAENRPVIVPVPEWTDATDWAYQVDPKLVPSVQMGYANIPNGGKHPEPEIFTADTATEGLLFSNDTLPIKIRDWYGVGVASYLGMGKQNVAG